jgi:hypothetical protein
VTKAAEQYGATIVLLAVLLPVGTLAQAIGQPVKARLIKILGTIRSIGFGHTRLASVSVGCA